VPGLIYDTVAVNPTSLAEHREEWRKIVARLVPHLELRRDPKTQPDAVAIMAAKVGVKASDYAQNMSGTYFLTLEEAKKRFQNAEGMDPSTARAKSPTPSTSRTRCTSPRRP